MWYVVIDEKDNGGRTGASVNEVGMTRRLGDTAPSLRVVAVLVLLYSLVCSTVAELHRTALPDDVPDTVYIASYTMREGSTFRTLVRSKHLSSPPCPRVH